MTYSSNSSDCFSSAVRADVKIRPQLLPFRQQMSAEHPSKFFVAIFFSMAIHVFLAYLLCVVVTDRTAVIGPVAPSIGAPLIVSLVSLPTPPTASHDGLDREVVSVVPNADPPAQHIQSLPERSRSIERKSEAESVMISKDQGVPGPEAPAGESFATDAATSIDVGAACSIAREVGRASMTEFELQDLRFKSRALYLKNRLGITKASRPDCRTAYANAGLLAIPFLLKDTITNGGCTWDRQEDRVRQVDRERQVDLGRQKDQERLEFMSDLMNDLIIEP